LRNIQNIREQVAAAEQLFGKFFEQYTKYSKRLTHLMTEVEERIQAQQVEVERQRAEIATLNEENGELCDITWTLLQTIKAGNLDLVSEMIRELGLKVSHLVEEAANEGKAPAVEAIAEVVDAVVETKVSKVAAEASDESVEARACAETNSPSSPALAKGSLNDIMERLSTLASETEVEPSPAEDVPVAAEDAALDVEAVPAEDRMATAS